MSIPYILPINQESLVVASNILLDGGVVCIPTDTVYGLAAIAINENAVKNLDSNSIKINVKNEK